MKHYEHLCDILSPFVRSGWISRTSGAVLLAFTLPFCGCLSRPPLNERTFAFSAPAPLTTNEPPRHGVLRIQSLQISPPFDGRSFIYRTGEFAYDPDPYAGFLGLPAEQLAGPVSEILRGNGCFGDVVETGSEAQPDALVDITLTQLYGDIRKPGAPFAVLAMRVTLLEATNGLPGRVILQRDYSRRISMASTSPAALIAGWNRAMVQILDEVASDFRSHAIEDQRHGERGGTFSEK